MKFFKHNWNKIINYLPIIVVFSMMLVMAVPVYAAYNYYAPISITNNSTNNYGDIPILVSMNNTQLASLDYILATGLDTDVQTTTSIPYSLSATRLGVFEEFNAYDSRDLAYYLGYTPNQTDYPIITGVGGYITTGDDAALELADIFAVEYSGYIDTTAIGETLISKSDAFEMEVDAPGSITVTTNITNPLYWEGINEDEWIEGYFLTTGTNTKNADNLYLWTRTGGSSETTWVTSNMTDLTDYDTLYIDWKNTGDADNDNESILVISTNSTNNHDTFDSRLAKTDPFVRVTESIDVSALNSSYYIRVHARDDDSSNLIDSEVWTYKVYLTRSGVLNAVGITSGEHKVEVVSNGATIKLLVDDVEEDSLIITSAERVIDNANDWIIGSNATPYIDSITFDIGGATALWYEPVTIILADTATDRSGSGNHGDITWGTNPAGIEITILGLVSSETFTASGDDGSIPNPLPIPSDFGITATNTTGITTFWMYDLVNRAAEHLGFSAQTMYILIGLIAATGVGFGALIGTGNMLGFAIGFGTTAGLFAASGVMPWWIIIIIIAIAAMGIYTWKRG